MLDVEMPESAEYKTYILALSRLSSIYIPEIRRKFAAKANGLFENETVRKLVLAYGEEERKLEADRASNFEFAARYPESEYSLEDSCLNHAGSYAEAIKFFFGI